MKILFFKLGALGDVLMTTPLVRQFRRRFPAATVDYLVGEAFARALSGNPHVDRIVPFPEKVFFGRDVAGWARLVRATRKGRYDVAFVLDKHWAFPLTAAAFGARRRIGFDRMGREGILLSDRIPYGAVRHDILCYLDLLGPLAAPDENDLRMDFAVSGEEARLADAFWRERGLVGRRVAALAPGGGVNPGKEMPVKRWPEDRWVTLIGLLKGRGYEALLIGGPTDRGVEEKILSRVAVPTAVGKSLGESAALMARSRVVVANDSGPMHLAAAAGARVVGLFGPTDPRRLFPPTGSAYLWEPGPCGPCYDVYGRCEPCPHGHACMENIRPESVLAEALRAAE